MAAVVEPVRVTLKETVPALLRDVLFAAENANVFEVVTVVVVDVATESPIVAVLSPHADNASAKANAATNLNGSRIVIIFFYLASVRGGELNRILACARAGAQSVGE